jgi:hypothetical protein
MNEKWAKELRKLLNGREEKIPKGYKTAQEWCEEFDIAYDTWRKKIPIFEQQGVMVRGYFRKLDRSNRLLRIPFWKRTTSQKAKQ